MDAIVLQAFVSLMLVLGSVVAFATSVRRRDHEHADRLSLLPIQSDDASPTSERTP